jgi:hypothetical protein
LRLFRIDITWYFPVFLIPSLSLGLLLVGVEDNGLVGTKASWVTSDVAVGGISNGSSVDTVGGYCGSSVDSVGGYSGSSVVDSNSGGSVVDSDSGGSMVDGNSGGSMCSVWGDGSWGSNSITSTKSVAGTSGNETSSSSSGIISNMNLVRCSSIVDEFYRGSRGFSLDDLNDTSTRSAGLLELDHLSWLTVNETLNSGGSISVDDADVGLLTGNKNLTNLGSGTGLLMNTDHLVTTLEFFESDGLSSRSSVDFMDRWSTMRGGSDNSKVGGLTTIANGGAISSSIGNGGGSVSMAIRVGRGRISSSIWDSRGSDGIFGSGSIRYGGVTSVTVSTESGGDSRDSGVASTIKTASVRQARSISSITIGSTVELSRCRGSRKGNENGLECPHGVS